MVPFLKQIALGAVLIGLFACLGFPQNTRKFDTSSRSVKGVITESGGKPASGAVVLLKDTKTLQVRSYLTKDDGAYRFYGLNSNDDYELRAHRGDLSSGSKVLSSFDNRREATIDLKLK
jgi:Carboxypeptidase regulatory-like domain